MGPPIASRTSAAASRKSVAASAKSFWACAASAVACFCSAWPFAWSASPAFCSWPARFVSDAAFDPDTLDTAGDNSVPSGNPVTFTATVTAPNNPGGTVTFYDGLTTLGSAPVSSGQAQLTTAKTTLSANWAKAVSG